MMIRLLFFILSLILIKPIQAEDFKKNHLIDPRAELSTLKKGPVNKFSKLIKTIKRKGHNLNLCRKEKLSQNNLAKLDESKITILNKKHKRHKFRNFRCFDHRGRKFKSPYEILEIPTDKHNELIVELDSKNIMGGRLDKYIPLEVEYKIIPPPLK